MQAYPRIVIVGAGFAGIFCARGLAGAEAHITLIDRENHHLFQPLLYQVATGFLGINDVAWPMRSLFRGNRNIEVIMGEVIGIDVHAKCVLTDRISYPYDYLVLAPGSRYHFFGHDDWAHHVQVLKTLEDAVGLRHQILGTFERAEIEQDKARRSKLLTYVIIGGGPTGVEVAGAIADVVRYTLPREFRRIGPEDVHIILLEAASRVLSAMPEHLSAYTREVLERKGVIIRCQTAVQKIEQEQVVTPQDIIETHTILWAAGVKPCPITDWLGVSPDQRGAVPVRPDLSVEGKENIYVLGDAALCMQHGKPLPALASVAQQQGKYLAGHLRRSINGKLYLEPFRYRDLGTMATIGRNEAVADFGSFTVKGWCAWLLWGIVHIYFLTGLRNRIVVFVTWIWTYITFGMGARIILGRRG